MKKLILALSLLCSSMACASIDMGQLENDLKTTGLVGYVHGTDNNSGLYVFTYRNPKDFFENVQMPMVSTDAAIMSDLQKTKRNQKVRLFGSFIPNRAPVKHIEVSKIELINDHSSELDKHPYNYKADTQELTQTQQLVARVHAVDQNGKMLVIEYKDKVVPVFVKNPLDIDLVKNLYRGDKISLRYSVRKDPSAPIHLSPKTEDSNQSSIEILENIKDIHGKTITQEGYLVRFPKSPQINFDVFAVLKEDAEGSNIQFTLVNFEDADLFTKVREKLEQAWKANESKVENGRNKLINKSVRIKATGLGNDIDRGQANPQILIKSLDDIQIL